MKIDKLSNYLNVTVTTILGVVGALTGGPALQAVAFLPTVAYTLYSDLSERINLNNKNLNKNLETLLKETCLSTQKVLSKGNLERDNFFKYANAHIEMNKNITNVSDLLNIIQNDLEIEKKAQAVDLTSKDIHQIALLFMDEFISRLHKYPELESYLITISLFDHEKRITVLERAKESTIHDESSLTINISDDTQFYCNKFNETLFLHRGLPEENTISLKDIYTLPGADSIGQWRKVASKEYYDIKDAVKQFINYAPSKAGEQLFDILFIEGQAAMGKSSLIAWLCWHYNNKDESAKEVIGDRCLITIRLRDISHRYGVHDVLNLQQPFAQFYAYLLKKDESQLTQQPQWENNCKKIFRNTILILEGFDELCMVETLFDAGKSIYFQNLSNELSRMDCGCKVIVTTRPAYLNVEELDFPKAHLFIRPFSVKYREKWIEKYEKKQTVHNEIKEILLRDNIQVLKGIIDSPLTMYMIVARDVHISETSNLWNIYHQIFAEEVYKRNYEKGLPHEINQYKNFLYRLTAEIANAVSMEEHFYITVDKLLEIQQIRTLVDSLDGLDENKQPDYSRIKDILEDCFGLASYFKIIEKSDSDGQSKCAVEFYHNNIKDYFCCEYIWMNLERIYSKIPNNSLDSERWFISNFQNMFQFSVFLKDSSQGARSMSIRFLESKIYFLKENNIQTDFICQEMKNHYLQHFFGKMLQTGMLYHYDYTGKDNILDMMACIYSAVLSIYHAIYLPYLAENERISITEEEFIVGISASFIYRLLFPVMNIYNQSHIKFDGIMFSGIEFGRHNFSHCSFQHCLLIGCDFKDCDLRGADFSFSSLQNADLSKAIIDKTTKFTNAELKLTKITKKQIQFFNNRFEDELLIVDDSDET